MRYKGNFWSLMTGRDEKIVEETPGPGAYETENPLDVAKTRDEEYRSFKRAQSRSLRYLDRLLRRNLREVMSNSIERIIIYLKKNYNSLTFNI